MPLDDSNPDLMDALQQVESKFPQGLRTDRPYDQSDVMWQGPFYGKGGPQLIRNPLTGAALPLQPGTTPDTYLQAVNGLAQAKARAAANVMRGWNQEQAVSEALAKAAGVDPSQVSGMNPRQAGSVVQAQVQARKEQELQQIRQQREQDRQGQQKRLADAQAEKVAGQQQKQAVMSSLPETMDALERMDPSEAMVKAPLYLGNLAAVNGPMYQSMLQNFAMRAQEKQAAIERQQQVAGKAADAQAAKENAAKEKQAAKDSADWEKNVLSPLDEVAGGQVKLSKVPQTDDDKIMGRLPRTAPDYQGSVAEYLASLRSILSRIARKEPGALDTNETSRQNIFAEARSRGAKSLWLNPRGFQRDEALSDKDPQQALESLRILAQVIQDHVANAR